MQMCTSGQELCICVHKRSGALMTEEFRLPRYKEIPDVGLLLDQVARLVNGYLEPYPDLRLTNSMISNYVKHGIIARPVKKLYYREQIASLVFIAAAKTVLSLEDIVTLLGIQRENHTPDAAYDMFCESFEAELCGSGIGHESGTHNYNADDISGVVHKLTSPSVTADAAAESRSKTKKEGRNPADDRYLLHSLIKAVADCIRLKELLTARR